MLLDNGNGDWTSGMKSCGSLCQTGGSGKFSGTLAGFKSGQFRRGECHERSFRGLKIDRRYLELAQIK